MNNESGHENPTLPTNSQAVPPDLLADNKLVIYRNTYTRSYIAEICYSPRGYLKTLKENGIKKYKKLGKYNQHWELVEIITCPENDIEVLYKLRRFVDDNLMLMDLFLKEPDLLQEYKKLYLSGGKSNGL